MKVRTISVIAFIVIVAFKGAYKATPYVFPELNFFPRMPFSKANPVTIEGVDLGRHLFYDTILSINMDMSCGTCHRQRFAFADSAGAFSKGAGGSLLDRNTLPLFNLAWSSTFFWDGRAGDVESQVFHPIRAHNEMNIPWQIAVDRISNSRFYKEKFMLAFGERTIDSTLITMAIAQFERTLLSYNSRYDKVLKGESFFTKDEFEGFELINDMTRGNCLACHPTDGDVLSTTFAFSNNGLDSVTTPNDYKDKGRGRITNKTGDNGKFKIPSLRNIALTAPYMHDGRFQTLDEVLDFYSSGVHASPNIDPGMHNAHSGGVHLNVEEKRKIIAFLHTLTDSVFITNPAFSNPFRK